MNLESFLSRGRYREMLMHNNKMQLVKECVRKHQNALGLDRIVWLEYRVVGKFYKRSTYDYDQVGIKEFLANLGILQDMVKIDWLKLSRSEQESISKITTKPFETFSYRPNKEWGVSAEELMRFSKEIEGYRLNMLVREWVIENGKYKALESEWERIKGNTKYNAINHESLEEYGTFRVVVLYPEISGRVLCRAIGEETIVRYGNVDGQTLETYAAKGFYPVKSISEFRKLKNVQLNYTLMHLESEERMNSFLEGRRKMLSTLSIKSELDWEGTDLSL